MRAAILTLLLLGAIPSAEGVEFLKAARYELGEGETLEHELWVVAAEARIAGTAADDLLIASTSNIVSGTANKDLWSLSDEVHVTGHIMDDARLVARKVRVSGRVDGDLLALGEVVQLSEESTVSGQAVLAGGHVITGGGIEGDARIIARQITLGGTLGGDLRLIADDIAVMRNTRILGDIIYTSPKELFLDHSVELGGELVAAPVKEKRTPFSQVAAFHVALFLGAVLVAVVFLAVFPDYTGRAVRLVRQSSWRSGLVGLAAFCALPLIAAFAFFTLVGIPFALVTGAAFFLLLYLSKIIVALALGGALLRRHGAQPFGRVLAALLVGLVLLYFLAALPILGSVVWMLTVFFGMGALILSTLSPRPPALPTPNPDNARTVNENQD